MLLYKLACRSIGMEKQLEAYLYQHIPITKAMGICVEYASPDKIIVTAPFATNINHKKTVFGGSLHAVATMACWCLLHVNLKEDKQIQIVITNSNVDYLAPVDGNFKAECVMPEKQEWQRFMQILLSKGRARIKLSAKIYHNDRLAVDYHAVFAAIKT